MAKSTRLHLPVFISKGKKYDVRKDELVYDWWVLGISFAVDREPWGIYFRINWGWVPKNRFKISLETSEKDISISSRNSKVVTKLLKSRDLSRHKLVGYSPAGRPLEATVNSIVDVVDT